MGLKGRAVAGAVGTLCVCRASGASAGVPEPGRHHGWHQSTRKLLRSRSQQRLLLNSAGVSRELRVAWAPLRRGALQRLSLRVGSAAVPAFQQARQQRPCVLRRSEVTAAPPPGSAAGARSDSRRRDSTPPLSGRSVEGCSGRLENGRVVSRSSRCGTLGQPRGRVGLGQTTQGLIRLGDWVLFPEQWEASRRE